MYMFDRKKSKWIDGLKQEVDVCRAVSALDYGSVFGVKDCYLSECSLIVLCFAHIFCICCQ